MADQILEKVRDLAEGQIDFEGQRLAELLATVLLAVAGAIAFVVGFVRQDITLALYVGLAGTALAFVVVVPPWPFFNQNPVPWLPVGGGKAAGTSQVSGGIVVDGKHVTT
ncbi:hypothetical protein O988_00839 [Pseudogymnoascus sp. VKM F-3808]|nr:hypothetical protein V490_01695 [Pseudogymnoascus sp. VKM F-3557]KFY04339.1 hypothetical protein O988_00839 [Pseudogymnoascus sp. VKM F-3808]KFY64974.1 hypothetical protein V497_01524 [Pseudogymnoascus sp. VKM F-4516 (FW-969)]